MLRFRFLGIDVNDRRVFARDDLLAQDGWSDFEDNLTRLDATITDIYISGSDPTLQVRARDGVNWTIELADRGRNRDAGLTDRAALPGDSISILGRRTHHFGENRIKAMQLTIGNKSFELYPDCLTAS